MKTFKLTVSAVVAAFAIVTVLLGHRLIAQQPAAAIFERARMLEETASQNLAEAIQLYQQVAGRAAENRPLAAQAQFRIGVLYERLGRVTEARQAYERVLSGHAAQQQVVADARARLNAISGKGSVSTGPAMKSLWTAPLGADIEGVVSPDGRFVPYGMANVLYLHDLTSGADRRLTDSGDARDYVDETIFSPDGKKVAYAIDIRKNDRYQLRVVAAQGTDVTAGQVLFDDETVGWIGPFDWSPDGKSIAVQLYRTDGRAQIGLLTVADGSLRVLKTVSRPTSLKMSFSPDGRYLAYDLPGSDRNEQRDVFVIALDSGREIPVLVNAPSHDTLVDWSPTGSHLLVASDRTGSTGLWQVPFKDAVAMQPELLATDIAGAVPMGLLKNGALYFERDGGHTRADIFFGDFDLETGRLRSPASPAAASVRGSIADRAPTWSADGKYLAYTTRRENSASAASFVINIRSIATGEVRELKPNPAANLYFGARWSPDGRSLIAASNLYDNGRSGAFRIDAQTGETTTVFIPEDGGVADAVLSPDGRFVYYRRLPSKGPVAIVKRDLASGQETELVRATNEPLVGWVDLSPDGRFIATPTGAGAATSNTVLLIPTDGSGVRTLPPFGGAGRASVAGWAPDSGSVYLRKDEPREGVEQVLRELWRVFLDGRAPIKLDTNLPPIGRAVISTDGQRIAFHVNAPAKPSEVWVMENFLPTSRK